MSGSHTTTSGRGLVLPPGFYLAAHPPDTKTLALTIAGAAVAGAVVWHFSRETYYSYVPPKVTAGSFSRQQGASAVTGLFCPTLRPPLSLPPPLFAQSAPPGTP